MSNSDFYLSELIEKEKLLRLNDYKIDELPVWRLFRFDSRYKVIRSKFPQITNNSLKRNRLTLYIDIIKRIFISLQSLVKLFFFKKQVDNILFAFPRLQNLNGVLIDKFTDPIIDQSCLNESCCVFQTHGCSVYKGIRWKNERVINIDLLYVIAFVSACLYLPYYFFTRKRRIINSLYLKAKSTFKLTKTDLLKWHLRYCRFYIMSLIFKMIFRGVKVKRIFIVDREVFFPQIFAAHKLNIVVYEIQHGVTCGNTVLYTGEYSKIIDPDFFLAFGERWKGPQFSIPIENIIDIGWAYKSFISNYLENPDIKNDSILFISSPSITEKMVRTIIELSMQYPDYKYYIRCHPQEMISSSLKKQIDSFENIFITDNTIDSYIALSSYNYVVGENSTVLYDALSLGKNVARLSYNGFILEGYDESVDDGFFYLYSKDDFYLYLNHTINIRDNNIYSSFKANIVNRLK